MKAGVAIIVAVDAGIVDRASNIVAGVAVIVSGAVVIVSGETCCWHLSWRNQHRCWHKL